MIIIPGTEIRNSLSKSVRVYLSGNLSERQTLQPVINDGLEIGISHYDSFTAEKAHFHKWNTEYNIVKKGTVKVYVFEDKKEYVLNEDDMYVIEPGKAYITKAQPGTEVMFVKSPGGNDKELISITDKIISWGKDWDARMK